MRLSSSKCMLNKRSVRRRLSVSQRRTSSICEDFHQILWRPLSPSCAERAGTDGVLMWSAFLWLCGVLEVSASDRLDAWRFMFSVWEWLLFRGGLLG